MKLCECIHPDKQCDKQRPINGKRVCSLLLIKYTDGTTNCVLDKVTFGNIKDKLSELEKRFN